MKRFIQLLSNSFKKKYSFIWKFWRKKEPNRIKAHANFECQTNFHKYDRNFDLFHNKHTFLKPHLATLNSKSLVNLPTGTDFYSFFLFMLQHSSPLNWHEQRISLYTRTNKHINTNVQKRIKKIDFLVLRCVC